MSDINVLSQTQVITVNPLTSAVSITKAGPVGPPGPPGSSGQGLTHTQASDSAVWTINHNFGYQPTIQTFTVGGLEVIGEIHHISNNQVVVSFNTPLSGSARLV